MQETGYAYTFDSNNVMEIEQYMSTLNRSFLSDCSVPTYETVSKRFCQLLLELEHKQA